MTAAAARRLLFVGFGASGAAALVYQVVWVRLSRGNRGCALKAFAAALELDPRDPSVYVNLGYMYVERGDVAAAAGFFSEALAIDTTSEAARRGLADARAAQR